MDMPPKIVRDTARRQLDASGQAYWDESKALSRRENYGLAQTQESLPVLQAFHEFIESERKAARGKLVTLSLFFIAIVISLIAAAMFISVTFFDQIRGDMDIVQGESENARRQFLQVRQRTDTVLTGLGHRTDILRSDLLKDRKTIESTFAQTTSFVSRLEDLSDVVKMLEQQNSLLRTDIGSMNSRMPNVSNALASAAAEIQRLQGHATESAPVEVAPSQRESSTIVASLALPGSETGTAWRFAIPE